MINTKLIELDSLITDAGLAPEVEKAAKILIRQLAEQRRELRLGDLVVSYQVYQ
jgi:hypothetical protein